MNIHLEEGTQPVKALERGSFQMGTLDRIAVIAVDFGSLTKSWQLNEKGRHLLAVLWSELCWVQTSDLEMKGF